MDACPDMILKLDKNPKMEVVLGNAIHIPLRANSVDAVLCISVLHHLSTFDRRKRVVEEICRVLKPNGQAIFYVWAFEQPNGYFKTQDVLVPFNLHEIAKSGQLPLIKFHKDSTKEERIINNSIPITIAEETCPKWFKTIFGTKIWKLLPSRQSLPPAIPAYLQQISVQNVQNMIVSGIHRWSPALGRRLINIKVEEQLAQEMSLKILEEAYAEAMSTLRAVSYYRFYHVFRKGEFQQLFAAIPEMTILETAFESGNWYLTAEKKDPKPKSSHNISI
uniref:Methyltransferase type 11 domain-containing protein n=2 Tax=Panagrolaimus sp. JU765 TaxID=591449 RepID=A0AC34R7L3_9BILA